CNTNDCNTNDCNINDCGTNNCNNGVNYQTHFSIRPQEFNAARWLIGTAGNTHLCGKEEFYGYAGVALEYTQSFKNQRLASYFGNANGGLSFGQGTIAENNPETIKAINWGLTGEGDSCLCAKVDNFVADLQFWVGLDEWVCGWWADLRLPIAWTKWQLNASNGNYQTGSESTYDDADAENSVSFDDDTAVVYTDIPSALNGEIGFGLVPALRYGKFGQSCNSQTASGIPGLRFDIGYDFYRGDCGYMGIGFTVVAPTGNRPQAIYLFEPILGAQKSWQIGGTLVGGWEVWNCNDEQTLTAYLDATVVTLLKSSQRRLFGLKDHGALSSFMLLKQFDNDGDVIGLDRVANWSALCGKFGSKVMTDVALMFQYTNCGFIADLGYDFWYRSREQFCGTCCNLPQDTYGLKGSLAMADDQANETASNSTIFVPADADSTTTFIECADFTACPALNPSAWSNKVFGSLGYQWNDCDWQPSLFLFGEAEFGKDNVAISQWGVGLKGGIAF
ncbi:hypothetical protein EB001_22165, partial [bacterium]|nr:hypothetical protein [bacterium]